jgi:predicted NBD/HSP70 family sugar kinase
LTGHIPGTTVLRRSHLASAQQSLGSNHVGLRAANERLVLSLIRTHGPLSKAQIAELSGLTAQTASVIARSLVEAGLLLVGAPVRGKIGQPYVPMSLNPDGAMFFGLHVEDAEARLALVNFTGSVIAERVLSPTTPDIGEIVGFAREAIQGFRQDFDAEQWLRVQGLGISLSWASADRANLPWQEVEARFFDLGQSMGLATYVSSDAVSACSAELIYGHGVGLSDFLYVFIDHSISGGLVQNGRIRFSRDDTGPNIGQFLVATARGELVPLRSLADIGRGSNPSPELIRTLARNIGYAAHSASSVVNYEAVIVDGNLPQDMLHMLTSELRSTLLDFSGGNGPMVSEGSLGRKGATIGAACLPLADRFFPEGSMTLVNR